MYLAADIGGTKTLLASINHEGVVTEERRFPTPPDYKDFLTAFSENYSQLKEHDYAAAVIAAPGRLDRSTGRALAYGTLKWQRGVTIGPDIEKLVQAPTIIENDAKLAGLSEAKLIIDDFKRVLYVTIGTGIGTALISNGIIDPAMQDSEGGQIWLDFHGKRVQWEDIASGHAIVKRFGKRASDIKDEATWRTIAHDIALGMIELIVVIQPEVIILGGGVDTNFQKFIDLLREALKKYETPLTPIPPIHKAKYPEEAVIYGCLELARQTWGVHIKAKA